MQLWPKPHEIAKEAETLSFVTLSAWIRAVWPMILVEWVCWVLPIRTNYHTKYPSVGHLWSLLNIETKRIWSISTWWQFRLLCAYLFQHSSVLFLVCSQYFGSPRLSSMWARYLFDQVHDDTWLSWNLSISPKRIKGRSIPLLLMTLMFYNDTEW